MLFLSLSQTNVIIFVSIPISMPGIFSSDIGPQFGEAAVTPQQTGNGMAEAFFVWFVVMEWDGRGLTGCEMNGAGGCE
jgi:hypothetical protein